MLHDISRPLYTGMPSWPGDTPTDFAFTTTIPQGALCNVGRYLASVHNGTHADAPFHYNHAGATIDRLPLAHFVGPARVVDVRGHAVITPALLTAHDWTTTPRLLLKTGAWTDHATFPGSWPLLAPETPAWLAHHGVRLLGLDVPSVDALGGTGIPRRHALDAAGILILESLDLSAINAGIYELIALPLKIRGGDGSPVRAVLREL